MSIWRKIFNKPDQDENSPVNTQGESKFAIRLDKIDIGYLEYSDEKWKFNYSDAFRNQDKIHRIVGFSDLNKIYESDILWPFFKVRIPGLKQPLIKDILEKEKIDKNNEVDLLKRFGRNNVSNPYKLLYLL